MEHGPSRRLAAIVAIDVVEYSRLVGADEEGTVSALRRSRSELLDPLITRHEGRVANTAGDSLLLEFPSAVNAVRCAIAIQEGMGEQNAGIPSDRRLRLRIGINVGDVIAEGDDLLGDGVNVAARLEALAEPGGICLSRSVRDHIVGKLPVELGDLGEVRVKNISRPVEAFRVVGDGGGAKPGPRAILLSRVPGKRAAVIAAMLVAAGVALFIAGEFGQDEFEPASVEAMAHPLPGKPSIVVLPFANLSGDPEQSAFADGIVEDLITDLSKLSGLFVIARNSSFGLKEATASIKEIAEELGVRYVLKGSVRRSGEALRINAQLIDAISGAHVWAERFDGAVSDIFAAQDAVTFKVVEALELQLTDSESTRIREVETEKVAAREAFQRGWDLYSRFNRYDNARSVAHFEKAVELDPDYGRAYGALALAHLRAAVFFDWDLAMEQSDAALYYETVPRYLQEAARHDSVLVHVVRAMRFLNYRDRATPEGANRGTDDARIAAATAISAQPNDPEAHVMMAWALIAAGKPEEGLGFVRAAMRLDPSYPGHYAMVAAAAHYAMSQLDRSATTLAEGVEKDPQALELLPMLASLRAQLGARDDARAALERWIAALRESDPGSAIDRYFFPIRWVDSTLNTRLKDGLRLAALPPEKTVDSLVAGLDEGPASQKVQTIRTLGWFGAAAAPAVERLIAALEDEDRLVRREAAISLGKIGVEARRAIPALESLSGEPIIGFHAKAAVERIDRE